VTISAGVRLGPYEIVSPLGAGGMGEVYRARDTRLHREVAIKVLPGSFSQDTDRLRRFEREARAASALNHPAILTVHDFGEHDGIPYVVTELLEGSTLRERLAGGRLPVRKALDYAGQIARGLAAAHAKGIVHRDVKPENVFVTNDGRVKILDFGLAKLAGERDGAAGTESPTQTHGTEPGVVMGTVGYMSPEQVKGELADARSDIFSFGAVLYEMLTGARAFSGGSAAETMSAILRDDPPKPSGTFPGVAASLDRIVRRCLEKSRQERFQSASDLAYALDEAAQTEAGSAVRTTAVPGRRRLAGWIFLGVLAAGLAAWFLIRPVVARRESDRLAGSIRSLVVLPLSNLSRDPEQQFFSDGMTEELIASLGRIRTLRVISRTSAMRYRETRKSVPEIARELNVDGVVEGTIQKAGDRVRITAQLIDAETDRQLWNAKYERDLKDVLALQSDVAQAIAREIQVAVSPQEQSRLARRALVDPEAHRDYLLGRYHWNQRSADGYRKALEAFQQSIAKDPTYASAWAGLADTYTTLGFYVLTPRETMGKAKSAALKALEFDPDLPEAHASLANILFSFDWNWRSAEEEFRRAIDLNPSYATGRHWHAMFLAALGRSDEALAEEKQALECDPLSLVVNSALGMQYYFARRHDEAIQQFRKALDMDSEFSIAKLGLGYAYAAKGMFGQAVTVGEKYFAVPTADSYALGALPYFQGRAGRRDDAIRSLEKLKALSKDRYVSPVTFLLAYLGLGEKDEAFAWLEKAYQERAVLLYIKLDPIFDPIRDDPRFAQLLRRMGLPA
jgi:eukaryotic-like serine/threonine-protein kinase